MTEKSVKFLGKKITYYISGSGEKTLVLLHGFLENASMWNNYLPELSKKYFVISVDIPGHGKSDVIGDVHTTTLMADTVDTVLKNESRKTAAFVGHSMGGYIALAFGERYGEKIKGVIMLNSTALADSEIKKADRDRAIKVIQKNPSIFIYEAIPNLFADQNKEKFKTEIRKIIGDALKIPKEGACSALRGMKVREEMTHLLKENRFPVHFISGGKDNIIPLEKIEGQVALNTSIKSVVFPDSGHMSFLEAKDECLSVIKEFLSTFKW